MNQRSKALWSIGVVASVTIGAVLFVDEHASARQALGVFTKSDDVGKPSTIGPGAASYDAAKKAYTIAGGGENMWATADHFHYVWKKVSGDAMLDGDDRLRRHAAGRPARRTRTVRRCS